MDPSLRPAKTGHMTGSDAQHRNEHTAHPTGTSFRPGTDAARRTATHRTEGTATPEAAQSGTAAAESEGAQCPRCGWPVDRPFQILSRHVTSEGLVTYTRCACGAHRMCLAADTFR